MAFAILRVEKLKSLGNVAGSGSHIERTRETPNADPEIQNRRLFSKFAKKDRSPISIVEQYQHRMKTDNIGSAKNSVAALEVLLTGSPERMAEIAKDPKQLSGWVKSNIDFLLKTFGRDLLTVDLHLDERTPHIHAIVQPTTTKLDARRKDGVKVTKLNAKHYVGSREKLRALQDDYGKAMRPYQLVRGIRGSVAKHQTLKDFYTRITNSMNELESAVQRLPAMPSIPKTKLTEGHDAYQRRVMGVISKAFKPEFKRLSTEISDLKKYATELENEAATLRLAQNERARAAALKLNNEYERAFDHARTFQDELVRIWHAHPETIPPNMMDGLPKAKPRSERDLEALKKVRKSQNSSPSK
jgi:hypothetical protein